MPLKRLPDVKFAHVEKVIEALKSSKNNGFSKYFI